MELDLPECFGLGRPMELDLPDGQCFGTTINFYNQEPEDMEQSTTAPEWLTHRNRALEPEDETIVDPISLENDLSQELEMGAGPFWPKPMVNIHALQ